MKGMDDILENAAIDAWATVFSRSPEQANSLHGSDAELVALPGMPDHYMAITIDTVAEEILSGLYRDPYTMGWVTVMASLSDLAAVGADPLGLVVSVSTPPDRDSTFVARAALGMEEASRSLGVFVLGGDSNTTPNVSLTGCAIGIVPRGAVHTRCGMAPGDAVFMSGRAGAGNAMALVRFAGLPEEMSPEERYRPVARVSEGLALRGHAGVVMDTSDGVLATLDQLARLNRCGFDVDCDWEAVLSEETLELCSRSETPRWMMLAGPHGEFELVFTVSSAHEETFAAEADGLGLSPVRLGRVRERGGLTLEPPSGRRVDVDAAPFRNLLSESDGDMKRYMSDFVELGRTMGLE